jgi:2-polyprenyl-3-methyl-5-hydroxy-6-metoxy-1,4-benzoquinol methylase
MKIAYLKVFVIVHVASVENSIAPCWSALKKEGIILLLSKPVRSEVSSHLFVKKIATADFKLKSGRKCYFWLEKL